MKKYLPVVAFFAGFLWDALTIGKNVNGSDLIILSVYLFTTVPIIAWLVKRANLLINNAAQTTLASHVSFKDSSWKERLPYLLLQFLFGSLFSALCILYSKNSFAISKTAKPTDQAKAATCDELLKYSINSALNKLPNKNCSNK